MTKPKSALPELPTANAAAPTAAKPPEPVTQATIRHLNVGYTVTTANRFGQSAITAHSTLAGALAELARAMTPPGKAAKATSLTA